MFDFDGIHVYINVGTKYSKQPFSNWMEMLKHQFLLCKELVRHPTERTVKNDSKFHSEPQAQVTAEIPT